MAKVVEPVAAEEGDLPKTDVSATMVLVPVALVAVAVARAEEVEPVDMEVEEPSVFIILTTIMALNYSMCLRLLETEETVELVVLVDPEVAVDLLGHGQMSMKQETVE